MNLRFGTLSIFLAIAAAVPASGQDSAALATIEFNIKGQLRPVVVTLNETSAPNTVANFRKLAESGYYLGLAVHRAIPDYLVQLGDPFTKDESQKHLWGTGGPDYTVPAEISLPVKRGSLAAARLPDQSNPSRASSGSQFFIALDDLPSLNGQYTVFGQVIRGIEHLDYIANQTVDTNDVPLSRIEVVSASLGTPDNSSGALAHRTVNSMKTAKVKVAEVSSKVAGASTRAAGAIRDRDFKLPKLPRLGLGKSKDEDQQDEDLVAIGGDQPSWDDSGPADSNPKTDKAAGQPASQPPAPPETDLLADEVALTATAQPEPEPKKKLLGRKAAETPVEPTVDPPVVGDTSALYDSAMQAVPNSPKPVANPAPAAPSPDPLAAQSGSATVPAQKPQQSMTIPVDDNTGKTKKKGFFTRAIERVW